MASKYGSRSGERSMTRSETSFSGARSEGNNRKKIRYRKRDKPSSCYLPQFDTSKKYRRGGCILYTATSSGLKFCLGIDRKYEEYTDFGGSFDEKQDKDIVDTALRELKEETLGLCNIPRNKDVDIALAVYGKSDFILFIPISTDVNRFTTAFSNAVKTSKKDEMSGCIWLSKEELVESYKNKKMYKRVAKLLSKVSFFEQLK